MKVLEAIFVFFSLLACQSLVLNCQKIGDLDLIDYDTQILIKEQEFFKNKHIVLVFCELNK